MHERLGSQLAGLDPSLQVDVVWALCVLQQARAAGLQAVLHPDFHAQFLGEQQGCGQRALCAAPGLHSPVSSLRLLPKGGQSLKDRSTFQKLLHINASAQLECPDYKGPLLPASALVPRPSGDRKVTPLQKELQDTLKGLLGSADRARFLVAMQFGWVLGEGSPALRPGW